MNEIWTTLSHSTLIQFKPEGKAQNLQKHDPRTALPKSPHLQIPDILKHSDTKYELDRAITDKFTHIEQGSKSQSLDPTTTKRNKHSNLVKQS